MVKDADSIPEPVKRNRSHPRIEQLFMKMAVESLSKHQQEMWFLWNNERLTQDELAKTFDITQQAVNQRLQTIETKIKKWCELNKGAYMLLKLQHKIMDEDV